MDCVEGKGSGLGLCKCALVGLAVEDCVQDFDPSAEDGGIDIEIFSTFDGFERSILPDVEPDGSLADLSE